MEGNGESHIVITGGVSGIGLACTRALAGLGYRIWATHLPGEDTGAVADLGPQVRTLELDFEEGATVDRVLAILGESLGACGLAGLVNNAGVDFPGPLEFLPLDFLRRQFEINVVGHVAMTQGCLPLLRRGKGRLIFVGSIDGKAVTPFQGAYGASKHAIEAIADVFRMELRAWGIPVSVVEPGDVATPLWSKTMALADKALGDLPPEAHELYGEIMAGARRAAEEMSKGAGPPEKVARAVVHGLTSRRPKTRYLVGMDAKIRLAMEILPARWVDRIIMGFIGGRK